MVPLLKMSAPDLARITNDGTVGQEPQTYIDPSVKN